MPVGALQDTIGVNLTLNPVTDCCLTIKSRYPRILAPYSPLRRGEPEMAQSHPLLPLKKGSRGVGGVGQESFQSPPS
jgi:hypothetical protein